MSYSWGSRRVIYISSEANRSFELCCCWLVRSTWVKERLPSPPAFHINDEEHDSQQQEGETSHGRDVGQRPAESQRHELLGVNRTEQIIGPARSFSWQEPVDLRQSAMFLSVSKCKNVWWNTLYSKTAVRTSLSAASCLIYLSFIPAEVEPKETLSQELITSRHPGRDSTAQ